MVPAYFSLRSRIVLRYSASDLRDPSSKGAGEWALKPRSVSPAATAARTISSGVLRPSQSVVWL